MIFLPSTLTYYSDSTVLLLILTNDIDDIDIHSNVITKKLVVKIVNRNTTLRLGVANTSSPVIFYIIIILSIPDAKPK